MSKLLKYCDFPRLAHFLVDNSYKASGETAQTSLEGNYCYHNMIYPSYGSSPQQFYLNQFSNVLTFDPRKCCLWFSSWRHCWLCWYTGPRNGWLIFMNWHCLTSRLLSIRGCWIEINVLWRLLPIWGVLNFWDIYLISTTIYSYYYVLLTYYQLLLLLLLPTGTRGLPVNLLFPASPPYFPFVK